MWSTKSIPVVSLQTIQSVEAVAIEPTEEETEGCLQNTLSFQIEHYQQLVEQAQVLQKQAKEQVKKAQQETEQLYLQAKQDITRWEEEAKAQGFEQGFEEGQAQGFEQGFEKGEIEASQKYEQEIEKVAQTWKQVNAHISQEIESISPQLVELMIQAVEKITKKEFEAQPELLEGIIQEMVLTLGKRQRCLIYVSPTNVDRVEAYVPTLEALTPETRFQIIPNVKLGEADAKIETEVDQIDLTLDTQLETLKEVWIQAVNE